MTFKNEAQFQRFVESLLLRRNWTYYHINDSRKISNRVCRGFPDLVIMKPPHILYVELKVNGNPSSDQMRWLRGLRQCDQKAFVLRPSSVERFRRFLEDPDKVII